MSSLTATLLGALQGTLAVLLTTAAGYVAARPAFALLDRPTVARLSRIGSSLFLPLLIISSTGPQLTISSIYKLWIMLVWALLSSAVAHGLGWGELECTLPLLLLESLKTTGVLDVFEMEGSDTLQRARTIVLLNSIVQEIITFALGPRILHLDSKKPTPPPTPASSSEALRPGVPPHALGLPTIQDHEHVGLLDDVSDASGDEDGDDDGDEERTIRTQVDIMSGAAPLATPSKAARLLGLERAQKSTPGKTLGRGVGKTWEAAKVWMNPALVGGLIALILGIIPPFHAAFFSSGGVFTNTITKAADNLGGLFGALQMFTLGATLALTPSSLKAKPTVWVLLVRYVLMPAISMGAVWSTAGRGWYDSDGLMWFLLILVPSGPSALLLLSVAQQEHVDEGPVAGFLIVAYLCAPLMAFVCSLGMSVVQGVQAQ
ncbi:hypothetical protein FIBSPDRAFT_1037951 [Athelia psychrophila]|uniref:Auxin efflux carrier n=1 Tax=Athelia psychrophila TaxID=1759441 RepID=A0A166TJ80_9AGAM|nr:hypothetical protein FIBSPDRAFT_1037951 [Fibularhizoctonia sp. CBS 109695]